MSGFSAANARLRVNGLPARLAPLASAAALRKTRGAAPALGFRSRLVNVQRAAVHLSAVQCRDRPFRFRRIRHFDKSETTRPARIAVRHHVDAVHLPKGLKQRSQRGLSSSKIKVSNKYILHPHSLCLSIVQARGTYNLGQALAGLSKGTFSVPPLGVVGYQSLFLIGSIGHVVCP